MGWLRDSRRRLARLARLGLVAVVLCGAMGASPPAAKAAATIDPALEWRNIGPLRAGRSLAAAGSPNRPDEYYAGATGGGLWKTTDGGGTWSPVTDGQLGSASVGAVAVCEADPDVVYAGMGEADLRNDVLQGNGVYRSSDGGRTWAHAGLSDSQAIARIVIDPADCDRVYAAAMGHTFGANDERGVFRSADGGRSWRRVLYANAQTGAASLAMDPRNPRVLYAGLWYAYHSPWTGWSGGPGSGLYKSTDGGDTWSNLTRNPGLPAGLIGKVGVSVSGADSDRVYAIVEARNPGVFASDDGGSTWRPVNDDAAITQRPAYYTHVIADPRRRDTVYVLTDDLWKSTDGGRTFAEIEGSHGDKHDLWIDPGDSERMIDANDGGATVTVDGGATWTAQDYSTAQLYHVTTTDDVPYLVCGAQQDYGALCLPSDGRGDQFFSPGGGESGYIAVDPRDSNVFYGGSLGGALTRFDRRLPFQRRRIDVWPEIPFGQAPGRLRERFQWTFPIATTPAFPEAVYAASQHLVRSTDGGQSFERISPDLTRAVPETLRRPGGPIYKEGSSAETYGTIFAAAPSPLDRGLIWAGSDDGLIHVTTDGGRTWRDVTPPGLPIFTRVSVIEASPHDPATAYVAVNRYQLDDRQPLIYRTHDLGHTWTKIVGGIPAGDFAYVVREDPQRPRLLYAGTEHRVYVSDDDGDSWRSLRQNLPDTSVQDLVVKDDDLVIATHGRGFYVMDDISPLRQAGPQPAPPAPTPSAPAPAPPAAPAPPPPTPRAGAAVQLFEPADVVRLVDPGATVHYWLATPAGRASLTFLDDRGKAIRTFDVPATAGMHRFVWDLRYPGPALFDGLVMPFANPNAGPRAPWGTYAVRLTVDGASQEQSFDIRGDSRLTGVGPAQIREQFRVALAVRDHTSDATRGVIAIRDCRGQIDDRVRRSGNAAVARAGADLEAGLARIERALYQTKLRDGDDEGHYPYRLVNKLASLLPVIESAENRPTDQTYAVLDALSRRLERRLNALDGLFDAPAFNALLRARGLEPIACGREGAR